MNYRKIILPFIALLACTSMPLVSQARPGIIPSPAGSNNEFFVEAGLTYASGVKNVVDQLTTNMGFESTDTWPVGIKISAYTTTPSGFAFGGGFGPSTFIEVRDRNHHYYNHDDKQTSYIFPVFADVRYYFPKSGTLTPYARAGVAYPFSGGDLLGSGTPGPVVAVGLHVWEHRILAIGVEAGYDGSKVEVKEGYLHGAEKVQATEFTLSVFAVF
ncbi:MAG: hypothetical protein IPP19_04525 [Verrucomicrobia bacterium]|nr:hypothetical protein [Verrucomicrobiota bacterium]